MASLAQKRLADLLRGFIDVPAGLDCWIADIQQDSRLVKQGGLFIAAEGIASDGSAYINDAIERGAVAVLRPGSRCQVYESQSVVVVELEQVRPVVGAIAHRFFGEVTAHMRVIAVTGTNGKSSVTHYIAQLAQLLGVKAAVIGTLGYGAPDRLRTSTHTTPDPVSLQRQLFELYKGGFGLVAIEVSSHALDQHRVVGVEFSVGAFLNLSRDHLDYHGSMEDYAEAKKKLIDLPGITPVLNLGDTYGRQWADARPAMDWLGFALKPTEGATIWADAIEYHERGTCFKLCSLGRCSQLTGAPLEDAVVKKDVRVECPLLGWFNLENLLAALLALISLGYGLAELLAQVPRLKPVDGRMQRLLDSSSVPTVIVDYAHTPEALSAILRTLKSFAPRKLWCVFGCGGDRDRGKRALMGQAASDWADHIMLTDDNPRHEAPAEILADIMSGIKQPEKVTVLQPRERAIAAVLEQAHVDDIVLIAGKGHENYQEIKGRRQHFSDQEVAAAWLAGKMSSESYDLKLAGSWR